MPLSVRLGWPNDADWQRAVDLLRAAGLPTRPPQNLAREQMLDLMRRDKKVLVGQLRLVLLSAIGSAVVTTEFDNTRLSATLDACLACKDNRLM